MPPAVPAPPLARALHEAARTARARAHVPFSSAPVGAALLLADGRVVPGVRVESASFSLTAPALVAAYATAAAHGVAGDVVAVALSRPVQAHEEALLAGWPEAPFHRGAEGVYVRGRSARAASPLPEAVGPRLDPFLDADAFRAAIPAAVPADAEAPLDADAANGAARADGAAGAKAVPPEAVRGVAQARALAEARAYVPASAYPVGAVLALDDGRRLPGVNVEHGDWARTLCAERTALATACAYGCLDRLAALYLACPRDTAAVPCGACRQWLVELAPDAVLWMDRLHRAPTAARPAALLPGAFQGRALSPPDAPGRA